MTCIDRNEGDISRFAEYAKPSFVLKFCSLYERSYQIFKTGRKISFYLSSIVNYCANDST